MPPRETDGRYPPTPVGGSGTLAVVRRKTELGYPKTRGEPLFLNGPVWRDVVPCERPDVKPGHHQRFVARKVDHGSDPEGAHELGTADRSRSGHQRDGSSGM